MTIQGHLRSSVSASMNYEEPLRAYVVQHNNCGFECEGSEDIASERSENRHLRPPPFSFDAPSLANPREYPYKSYLAKKLGSPGYNFVADSI